MVGGPLSYPSFLHPRTRRSLLVRVLFLHSQTGRGHSQKSSSASGDNRSHRRTVSERHDKIIVAYIKFPIINYRLAVYLVSCLVYQTLSCAVKWTDWLQTGARRGWPYVEAYAWPLASVAQTATVWLVVVLTADHHHLAGGGPHGRHPSSGWWWSSHQTTTTVWLVVV